ncbi:MAG TPA: exodeoxyribonuclease VII small subunit [Bacteroidota bacterium]|jgi:exodeoxyribonuclease VII small subunit|nr:exodeoxyribonuclease VII small subunit [Bacteroidota bacterium]
MTKKAVKDSLEESLKRLEEIVGILEGGEIPLEESLDLFEEGILLSKNCSEKLKKAELRIQKLVKNLDGQFELHEFYDKEEEDE